jgi:beta-glucosidase
MFHTKCVCIAATAIALMAILTSGMAAQESQPLYKNPVQPVDKRAEDLVGRMTLEEKASQLVNHTRAIPRLGIPEYDLWSEALHGVANNGIATVFPQAIGLGATFDAPLLHKMAEATAREGRAKFNLAAKAGTAGRLFQGLTFFSPNINIVRDPRWGRGQETYGEDPFLTGKMGVAFITGLQGDDPKHLTAVATAKHYAVHSGPEPLRHGFDAKASKHDLEDTYLPAFREAVINGKVNTVMCVYNAVNGIPGCASEFLLNRTLREDWNFKGFVTGDCNAVDDIQTGHKYAKTSAEAAAFAIKAGTDNDCVVPIGLPEGKTEYQKYIDAVNQNLLSEKEVDTAVKRMMATRFALGLFDPSAKVKAAQTPDSELDSASHRQLALNIARESLVLLKNDGVLPMVSKPVRIAVVGPLADSKRVLLGNYNGMPSSSTTALEGIRKQFPEAKILFEPGTSFLRANELVPASVLSTESGSPGLKAEVYKTDDFSGSPDETRIDRQLAYGAEPGAALVPQATPPRATRWTGFFTPATSGKHVLGVEGFGNRLYLDGKKLIDTTGPYPPPPSTTEIVLEKGRRYALKIESSAGPFSSTRLVWLPLPADAVTRAVEAARQSDIVIAVVGLTSDLEGEESGVNTPGFKGGDRTTLDLPEEEQKLLEAVKTAGKPLVVVLMSGSALSVNWAKQHANAIVQAWYPGEEGGKAIGETLAGKNNPAGRLPVTFYKGVEQLPDFADYSMSKRTYRYFDGEPLYPFGYGLSYSSFHYSEIKLSKTLLRAGEALKVEAKVANASARDGDEVVQVYLTFPKLPGAPQRALRGFTRIHLRTGESRIVSFTLADRDLSFVNEEGTHLVGTGKYSITIGGGQPNTQAPGITANFEIQGERQLPR